MNTEKGDGIMKLTLPDYVKAAMNMLLESDFEAYMVGGAVRDLFLGKVPDDYDIVTNARPDEIKLLAEKKDYGIVSQLGQNFGVVIVLIGKKSVEIASYRNETYGRDAHRPAQVWYCDTLEEDLGRRDFTINAMAVDIDGNLTDEYSGMEDLNHKVLRTVGNADKRFEEDALRMFRACRFVAQLGFSCDVNIPKAIKNNLKRVNGLSLERVRVELDKLLCGAYADKGMKLMVETGLAGESCRFRINKTEEEIPILPELSALVGVEQNPAFHQYDVWQHTLAALSNGDRSLAVSWAILLHDIAKGQEGVRGYKDGAPTDYGHEVVGAQMAQKILNRLRYSGEFVKTVTWLVRNHMRFGTNIDRPDEVTWRWLRQAARDGEFRLNKDMAEAFKQLTALCVADASATEATEQELISAQMYGKRLVKMAYKMPVHTTDLNINGDDLSTVVTDKKQLASILPVLLRRVQDGNLKNEPMELRLAAEGWVERQNNNQGEQHE
jgi:tRNA nucleotidyltransferase/poly(A) polymerase